MRRSLTLVTLPAVSLYPTVMSCSFITPFGFFFLVLCIHHSCHGLRGLHLSQMSELNAPAFSKPQQLLNMVQGLELITLDRPDECCGFGGTFCVAEEAVSVKMGKDRVTDHTKNEAEYITSSDLSCLMHLEGIMHRNKSKLKVLHIAEILNSTL